MLAIHCNRVVKCLGLNTHDVWTLMFIFSPQIIRLLWKPHDDYQNTWSLLLFSLNYHLVIISLKCDCNTTHPASTVHGSICSMIIHTWIRHKWRRIKKKKTATEGRSRTRFGTGEEWPKAINTMKRHQRRPDNPLTTYQTARPLWMRYCLYNYRLGQNITYFQT